MEQDDVEACNEACKTFEEACEKRLELAAAVCAGLRQHPHWKSQEAACSAADEFRKQNAARMR
jgi:hypothetical protein